MISKSRPSKKAQNKTFRPIVPYYTCRDEGEEDDRDQIRPATKCEIRSDVQEVMKMF